MDKLLQPFPYSFSRQADLFVALSGKITRRRSEQMHRHDFYELVQVWEGGCTFFSDFERYPVIRGDLLFVSPGQLHDYFLESGHVRVLIIGFRPAILPKVAHELLPLLPFDNINRAPILSVGAEQKEAFRHLFQSAHGRFDANALGWATIVTAYLQTILTEAAYQMPEHLLMPTPKASVQLTHAFQQALEERYQMSRRVQDYAALLGVTTNHLVKTVRQTTGMTPKQMLQERLLLEAKRLLVHTPYPVSQISEMLHSASSTAFARWFKKQTGQTPSEFRKRPF